MSTGGRSRMPPRRNLGRSVLGQSPIILATPIPPVILDTRRYVHPVGSRTSRLFRRINLPSDPPSEK